MGWGPTYGEEQARRNSDPLYSMLFSFRELECLSNFIWMKRQSGDGQRIERLYDRLNQVLHDIQFGAVYASSTPPSSPPF